ncbi:MAG: prephenate dehydrogenase/arogenate dehydrogenase family protein, partial [Halobacteriovoraceae bacterium]|nr:prephenate dehydrogenase/arogenate dehydrogenase family protein [Halobacteriovoraceae bacterium]
GAKTASLEEVCQCPMIIPFVPISALQNLLSEMKDLIKKDALVIDVCSVKTMPLQWMKEILPESISLLGTHPMFGPDSAKNSLYGCKIVLCPVRINNETFKDISGYLETHGLKVIEASPEEHDKQIAHSLLLTHFLGRTLMDFGAKPLDIDTKGYRRLMKILETVENDTWQLFEDMNKYNPYAKETREEFIQSLSAIHGKVNE